MATRCPDHDSLEPFCDVCVEAEAAEPETFTRLEHDPDAIKPCWLCGQAGPSAGDTCERCAQGERQPKDGQARLQAWLARRGLLQRTALS